MLIVFCNLAKRLRTSRRSESESQEHSRSPSPELPHKVRQYSLHPRYLQKNI